MSKYNVLIPLNKSELSQEILPCIEQFISPQENKLILFYLTNPPKGRGFVVPDPDSNYALEPGGEPVGPKAHPIYASQEEDNITAHVETALLPVTNQLKEAGYEVTVVVDFSREIVDEILRVIENRKVDLVAMSTRARIGVTRFFFRDIADTIAQKANIPVLLTHPTQK